MSDESTTMNDFAYIMSGRTDEQLIAIVTVKRHEYQPEALEAADQEFKRRNLSPDLVHASVMAITEKDGVAQRKAIAPLSPIWKVLAFLFPGAIFLIAMVMLKSEGRDRQASELGKWTLFGIGFYIILIMLLTNL